jgi:hypothetical protein
MSILWRRLRAESGQGLVSALLLLAGVLLPLLFLVPLFARLEQGRLSAAQLARDAVRASVEAPTPAAAQAAARQALERARSQTPDPVELTLNGDFARGGVLHATASVRVSLASLPLFGRLGQITLTEAASAPVDQYRSLLQSPPP